MAPIVAQALLGMMEESMAVHPFFAKSTESHKEKSEKHVAPPSAVDSSVEAASDPLSKATTRGGKRANTERPKPEMKPETKPETSIPIKSLISSAMLEVDLNNGRRKRAKTTFGGDKGAGEGIDVIGPSDPNQITEGQEQQRVSVHREAFQVHDDVQLPLTVAAREGHEENVANECRASERSVPVASKEQEVVDPEEPVLEQGDGRNKSIVAVAEPITGIPRKILRLNPKTGTIGSPPAKKPIQSVDSIVADKTSKFRSRKSRSHILIIHYGHNQESRSRTGARIDQILRSTRESISKQASQDSLKKSKSPKAGRSPHPFFTSKASAKPPKSTHPFFSGKATIQPSTPDKAVEVLPEPPRPKVSMVSGRGRPVTNVKPASAFAGFGKTERMFKFPGAMEPAWPWKDAVHIRGHSREIDMPPIREQTVLPKPRKSKGQAVEVLLHEDVMGVLAKELSISDTLKCLREFNLDDFGTPPPCLRLPKRHFEAGRNLQRRVLKEVHAKVQSINNATRPESSSDDEIQHNIFLRAQIHPALMMMYSSITTSLSPFDQSQCETQSWISKYSPKSAVEVLQIGREAIILKEWLQTLTVTAIETSNENSRSRATSVASRRSATSKSEGSGKRKRKSKKLDGFIVSSDEENNDMDEISDLEDFYSPHGSQGLFKKTVIRAGDTAVKSSKDSGKVINAVVISGPHGCGKTAAVYAVAKELGFEVFEINSSSRRSGKDVLEKVGDMTRNHLVQHLHKQVEIDLGDDDMRHISDALAEDLKSGRQGTMNSFFKPKESSKSKLAPKKIQAGVDSSHPKAASKQKQSLILLDEVDILYEEDKQFWTTVMTLIAQSKRPVIMTCTDEAAVPLHQLQLHAIIRFTPPPIDLAVDYMLLVAANEGHAIRREAVKALYQSKRLDLRASLMDLDFWCQFTVGDCKGGLEWFYPRWPPGRDVDDHGDTVRVVSEGTYQTGMGWLCQDFLKNHSHCLEIEEETLHEGWNGWNLDVGDWQKNLDISTWANKMQSQSNGKSDDRAVLNIYDDFTQAMSAADLCSGSAFASDTDILFDMNPPEIPVKTREDYVLGYKLLEVSPLVQYDNLGMDISMWMKSHTRKHLQVDQHIKHGWEVPAELERPGETQIVDLIRTQSTCVDLSTARRDFSLAFDPISEPEKNTCSGTYLEPSCFDRTITIIATEIAPYVRSIVAYDARLQQERTRLSSLFSEGGRKGKRLRTTRSAMSALEGGTRSTTRRDRYFGPNLNPQFVLKTGLQSWQDAVTSEMSGLRILSKRYSNEVTGKDSVRSDTSIDELTGDAS